jgi:hypothetical protein
MTNQRKQIIINEITFWKQNKLLPEHYCDFLMTLYTEGQHVENDIKGNAKKSVRARTQRNIRLPYLIFPLIAILLIAAMYVVEATWIVYGVAIVFGLGCLVAAFYFAKKNTILAPILHMTSALTILFVTFNICLQYFPSNDVALYITLIANCVIWLITGLILRLTYFSIAGGLGLLAIVIYSAI